MPRPILATIDTEALSHNLRIVAGRLARDTVDSPRIWAVIKARGYGHGLSAALQGFSQADGLAMLDLDEAVHCRESGWSGPILLLEGFFETSDLEVLNRYRIATTLHCNEQMAMLEACRIPHALDAYVKLDSGMHRLGFLPDEFRVTFRRAQALRSAGILNSVGKMTHFARADDDPAFTREQLARFQAATQELPGPVSVCNSAATLTPGFAASVSDCHAGQTQWVRPGICLYGASPFAGQSADSFGLHPAMTLSSQLISAHVLPTGEAIGYGQTFRADHAMRVGIVACGYADGYPRHAVTGTPVTVAGVRTQLLGRVSMDMLAVDLGPVPQAHVGSPVVLWGVGGPSVDEVALSCGTIGYELLTAITPRVPRSVLQASPSGNPL
ncbi:MAG: alanine racemase [Castellaniella sp.]|uniref:alanine racemase n=1 Tax=Castellaniella sp. TaxID=1955812 RepID=UPI001229CF27|nr:alanine racemase [Castellaniella sp.]TAN30585.1 MAG: alanine racemase [Castellaniella sp.]